VSDQTLNPANHLAALQAAQAFVDSPGVQEVVKPSRAVAAERFARTTSILLDAFNAFLSPLVRYRMSQDAATREHGEALNLGEQAAQIQRTVFFEELQDRAARIPEDRLQPPPLHVAGPAIQAMLFTEDAPQLRRLYVNLLGTSMDREAVKMAHPAFVDLIRQFSPDEARILKILKPTASWPEVDLLAVSPDDADVFDTVAQHVSTVGEEAGCAYPDLTPAYVDNLCRLGITTVPYGGYLDDESLYTALEKHPKFVAQEKIATQNGRLLTIRRSYLTLTDFGKLFWEACVAEPLAEEAHTYPDTLLERYKVLVRQGNVGTLSPQQEQELAKARREIQAISSQNERAQAATRQVEEVNVSLEALETQVDARIAQREAEQRRETGQPA
jgi:hypothetical protein